MLLAVLPQFTPTIDRSQLREQMAHQQGGPFAFSAIVVRSMFRARIGKDQVHAENRMNTFMLWIGRVSAAVGALLCIVAVALRISGRFFFGSFQVVTLLTAGIAVMVAACVCLLLVLSNRGVGR
jgi:hypothetical protein